MYGAVWVLLRRRGVCSEERGLPFFQEEPIAEELAERASASAGREKLERGQDESPKPTELNLEFTTERLRELNKRCEPCDPRTASDPVDAHTAHTTTCSQCVRRWP